MVNDNMQANDSQRKLAQWVAYLTVASIFAAIYAAAQMDFDASVLRTIILTLVIYFGGLVAFLVALWLIKTEVVRLAFYGLGIACMAFAVVVVVHLRAWTVGLIGGAVALILIYFGVTHIQKQ